MNFTRMCIMAYGDLKHRAEISKEVCQRRISCKDCLFHVWGDHVELSDLIARVLEVEPCATQ